MENMVFPTTSPIMDRGSAMEMVVSDKQGECKGKECHKF